MYGLFNRRQMITAATAGVIVRPWRSLSAHAAVPAERFDRLEQTSSGRLGVAVLDTASGQTVAHRGDERFGLCSTAKLVLVAQCLTRVDAGADSLERIVVLDPARCPPHSPITQGRRHLDLATLCSAAITVSDNGAANALFARLGGPDAVTSWCRSIGDKTTRLDRMEPYLNDTPAGELRDTTTPSAMATSLQSILTGDVLSGQSRRLLADWLMACRTGLHRLRAGLPDSWRVGDKTGTGAGTPDGARRNGLLADVAIGYPPDRAPVIITAWVDTPLPRLRAETILAEVGRIAATVTFGQ